MIPPWPCPYEGPPDQLPYHLRSADRLSADEPWIGALYLDSPDSAVEPAPAAAGRPSARNPGDGAAAGATAESHQEGRSGLGVRTPAAAAVSGERPQLEERGPLPPTSQVRGGSRSSRSDRLPPVSTDRPPGPSATTTTGWPGGHHGDRDEDGLPADRTVRPAPAVLSAPAAEPSGTSGIGHVPPHRAGVLSPGPLGSPRAAGVRGRHRAERPGKAGAAAVPGHAVLRWLVVWVPRLVGLALLFTGSASAGALVAVLVAAYGRR